MSKTNLNVSRRQALAGIGIAGAVATTPVAFAASPDRSAWNRAIARMEAAEAEERRTGAIMTAAHDAGEKACPRQDHFFRRYNLGVGDSREKNFRAAHMNIVIERTTASGRVLTFDEARQATADAYRIVDDFETYCAKSEAAFADYYRAEPIYDAAVARREAAREFVLTLPAPDEAALLRKLELLTVWLDEYDNEDKGRVNAVVSDARRILKGRAA